MCSLDCYLKHTRLFIVITDNCCIVISYIVIEKSMSNYYILNLHSKDCISKCKTLSNFNLHLKSFFLFMRWKINN